MCFGRIEIYHNIVVAGHVLFSYSSISNITLIFSIRKKLYDILLLRLESHGDLRTLEYTLAINNF